jgi:hypothetical protein
LPPNTHTQILEVIDRNHLKNSMNPNKTLIIWYIKLHMQDKSTAVISRRTERAMNDAHSQIKEGSSVL